MSKNDKLKPISVRMTFDMYDQIEMISTSEQPVPNIAATIRTLLQDALNARKQR
jgi:hypothetical protein